MIILFCVASRAKRRFWRSRAQKMTGAAVIPARNGQEIARFDELAKAEEARAVHVAAVAERFERAVAGRRDRLYRFPITR